MPRRARAIVPGFPHHVTNRGNRRMPIFFCDDDYRTYLRVFALCCHHHGVDIWAYCLMPNHAHHVLVPATPDGLARAIGEANGIYAREINHRERWSGHLWQARYASYAMDESYLLAAARYIEMNPVRAGLVSRPQDWRWSSATAHLAGIDDGIVKVAPLLARIPDWAAFLSQSPTDHRALRSHEGTGRPLGSDQFVERVEALVGRPLRPCKRGRRAEAERIISRLSPN